MPVGTPPNRTFDVADAYHRPGHPTAGVPAFGGGRLDELLQIAAANGGLDVPRHSASCGITWKAHSSAARHSMHPVRTSSPCACTSTLRGSPGAIPRPRSSSNCTPTRIARWRCGGARPPCTGIYVPYFVESGRLPDNVQRPAPTAASWDPRVTTHAAAYDPVSSWWRWQQLLDVAKDPTARDFAGRAAAIRREFDVLERQWLSAVADLTVDPDRLTAFTDDCLGLATRTATG